MKDIYPEELALENDNAKITHHLDLDLEIFQDKISYKLFDKRDAFGFRMVNFPNLSGNIPTKQSYGVFVSQLIGYARCCQHLEGFQRAKILIDRLTTQGFELKQLKKVCEKFAINYYKLLFKYDVSLSEVCDLCN